MSELDQEEEVGGKAAINSKPENKPDSRSKKKPKDYGPTEILPLCPDDPKEIQGYTVVGKDLDGEYLVEFPEREPIEAMGFLKCPSCEEKLKIRTSGKRLAKRSYTICKNPECYYLKRQGEPFKGSVERRLTNNIKRIDEVGIEIPHRA
jgi:hypothetical protein